MKFTLSWLKDYLDTQATLDEIVEALNIVGLEVEEVVDPAKTLAGFEVARVIEARQHPDADRLKVCDVETSGGTVQVVCGAPNARTGLIGVFAKPGMYIPGIDMTLQTGVIRGVESAGMLCSERELEISDDHEGIIDLDGNFPVGMPAAKALGLDDAMIDIAITPNRPDALGVYGIARDLAARGLGTLKPHDIALHEGKFPSPVQVKLDFPDDKKSACPHFVGRYIKGVKNGPSPDWMQNRLKAVGLRPISALVDVTNYVNMAYGRPLHVFDADKLSGNIIPRLARNGEKLVALDDETYELNDDMTVIADEKEAHALGGIMGGADSGCQTDTVNVFVESAYFDPIRTATTGRKLNIQSDARYRFERGVDPLFTRSGIDVATDLILSLCGGVPSDIVEAGSVPDRKAAYDLRKSRVETLGGVKISSERQTEILSALGFEVEDRGDMLHCRVPGWRPDVHGEADLVEEVCRIYGLDDIEEVPLPRDAGVAKPVLTDRQRRYIAARRQMASQGMNEAVTYSFLPEDIAKLFGGGDRKLQLSNPISVELSDMRPSLLPNLISAAGRNLARGASEVSLFEMGQVYKDDTPDGEYAYISGIRVGDVDGRYWKDGGRSVNLFDAKADALSALAAAKAPVKSLQVIQGGPEWFHPGRSGILQLGPKNQLGWFGEIHPFVLEKFGIKTRVVGFECNLDAIPVRKQKGTNREGIETSDLMPVRRDIAFVVGDDVSADAVTRAAMGADKKLITGVRVFDVFSGAPLDEGTKSIAIEVTLQPKHKTLTDDEIEAACAAVIAKVGKATGGTLRG